MVVYDSWYGDTRRVAEEIARGIAQTAGVDPAVLEVQQAGAGRAQDLDLLVLGTPNHFGGPTRKMRQLVRDLAAAKTVAGALAVFDTCFATDSGKAASTLAGLARDALTSGTAPPKVLSIIVEATRGPIRSGELARAHAFGVEIARAVPVRRVAVPV